jgi:hypothetical protein
LATSGQLSAEESDRLNQHLVECDDCRSFLKEAQFLSDRIIPQALPASRVAMRTPDGMRERFLACAAKAGMTMQAGPALAGQVPIVESDQVRQEVAPGRRFLLPRWIASSLRPTPAWALAGIACVACFVLGRVTGNPFNPPAHSGSNGINVQVSAPQAVPGISPANTDSLRARALTGERDRLAKQVADLSLELEAEQKENQQVESSLEQKFTASVSDAARDYDALKQQSAALNTRAVELESELAAVRQQESLAEADLKSAREKTTEYSARLDLLQAELRNQDSAPLPDPKEVSSLVAARNLHIIDVYDSSPSGQRQRAFGRVFYVEGRSLVFYAYDLNAGQAQKNITFHLWGEKAGSKETTLSLGILKDDDPKERRWALTCDDTNALAKINSVYVTAESPGRRNDAPQGPRVLYAYFGAPPNHP